MRHIYNELIQHANRLHEFANHMVSKGLYKEEKSAIQCLRVGVTHRQDIQDLYDKWKGGKFKTKDVQKHNEKLSQVFQEIKRRTVKDELISVCEVLEEALMELTIAIKKDDKARLLKVKDTLQDAIYQRC